MDRSHYKTLLSAFKNTHAVSGLKLWPLYLSSTGDSGLVLERKKKDRE